MCHWQHALHRVGDDFRVLLLRAYGKVGLPSTKLLNLTAGDSLDGTLKSVLSLLLTSNIVKQKIPTLVVVGPYKLGSFLVATIDFHFFYPTYSESIPPVSMLRPLQAVTKQSKLKIYHSLTLTDEHDIISRTVRSCTN